MPQCLAKRYAGHEQEIIRDIKVHGNVGAMMKWGGSFEAWGKFVEQLKESPLANETISQRVAFPNINSVYEDRESLAEQLVEQFTHKVVTLSNRCREQESRISFLERQLAMYKDHNDEQLADKMIKAFELVKV